MSCLAIIGLVALGVVVVIGLAIVFLPIIVSGGR